MWPCDDIVVGATAGGAEAPPARGAVQPLWPRWPAFPSGRAIGNGRCRTIADQILRYDVTPLHGVYAFSALQRELCGCSLLPRCVTHYRASEVREYCEEGLAVTV